MAPRTSSGKSRPKQSTLTFGSKPITNPTKTVPLSKVIRCLTPDTPQTTSEHKTTLDFQIATGIQNHQTEHELWVEKYAPRTPEALAVHKQKIDQVSRWLAESFSDFHGDNQPIRKRILALTGPSGAGKTATITALARSMGFQIIEWKSGLDDWRIGNIESGSDDRVSLSRKFDYYLARANEYPSLSFGGAKTMLGPRKRLLLIDDIPNVQNYTIREAFHAALQRFVEGPGSAGCPLVIIISDAGTRADTSLSDGNSWRTKQQDTVDFRSVFPKSLQTSPLVEQIAFNPIAATLLRGGMLALLTRHYGPNAWPFTKEFIDMMIESAHGDLRSAIMTLQFAHTGQTCPPPTSRKKQDKARRETSARVLMENVSQREQSLQLFHLLGKLLYNKRYGDSARDDAVDGPPPVQNELPDHLLAEERKPSKVDLIAMYNDSPIDSSLLSLYVHQNYLSFCQEAEQADALCDYLSLADHYLSSESLQSVMLEYAFYITSAGTLHSLPAPVPRRNQKLIKPEYFDVLQRTQNAKEAAAATRMCLFDRHREWLYPQIAIETEFASVITDGVASCDEDQKLTHKAFTSFPEISRPPEKTASGVDGCSNLGMSNGNRFESTTASHVDTNRQNGWLSDDGIDDW